MQFLIENAEPQLKDYLKDFSRYVCDQLDLANVPPMTFVDKTGHTSFGSYQPHNSAIKVATGGRHVADVLRTLAHEIVHDKQMKDGEHGDHTLEELEYEANAVAGMLMRDWNKEHPEVYDADKDTDEDPKEIHTTERESQGATFADPTRPSGPINMGEDGSMGGGVAVNSAGSGAVAGLGVGPQGEPGVYNDRKKRTIKSPILKPMARRKTFAAMREEVKDPAVEARKKLASSKIPVSAKELLARRKLVSRIDQPVKVRSIP